MAGFMTCALGPNGVNVQVTEEQDPMRYSDRGGYGTGQRPYLAGNDPAPASPPLETARADADAKWERRCKLRATQREYERASSLAMAGYHEIDAEIARMDGDALKARWYDALARQYREGTPEATEAAASAWAEYQASKG